MASRLLWNGFKSSRCWWRLTALEIPSSYTTILNQLLDEWTMFFFLRIDIALNEHVVCFWKCSDQNMYDWITYQNTIYVYNYHRDTCMAMEYNIISLCDKHSTMFAPPKKDVYILVWQVYFKRNMWQWWTRGSWGTLYTETIENFCGLGYCTQKPQVLSMRV
jgi:hypothetical protein